MGKLLNTLLTRKLTEKETKWYNVIIWWELRRIPYNLTLLLTGIISILCMSLVVDGAGDFISGLAIIGFAFFANFFYTFGWLTELSVRIMNKQKATSLGLKLFKTGFIIAICGTFAPTLIFGIAGLVKGEKFSSPYSNLTTTKPEWTDISGEYKLADVSISQMKFPDSLANKTLFKLNTDSTFTIENFPDHGASMSISKYEIIDAKGKWKMREDNGNWVIPMSFYETKNKRFNYTYRIAHHNGNGFKIKNNEPPYEIYIMVGDPDSWEGLTLQKK